MQRQYALPEIGRPAVPMYTQAEVDSFIANIRQMQLSESDPCFKLLGDTTFQDLDKLFNGPFN